MVRSTLAALALLGGLLFIAKTLSDADDAAHKAKVRAALETASLETPSHDTPVTAAHLSATQLGRLEFPILSAHVNEDGDEVGGPSPVPGVTPSPAIVPPSAHAGGFRSVTDPRETAAFIAAATSRIVTGVHCVSEIARAAQASRSPEPNFELPKFELPHEISIAPTHEPLELAIRAPVDMPAAAASATVEPNLSPEMIALRDKVRKALAMYEPRHLNTRDNSCWEVMHSLVAFGVLTKIRRDGPEGELVNAAGWLTWGGRCQGQPLVVLSGDKPNAQQGPGVEGHPGQLLAILAQSRVPADYQIRLGGKSFTIADLIEQEKLDCQPNTELTFRLIGLTHYLPSDATWTSREGEKWSIPRLIQEEIRQPIHGASCGGSHRLYGISYSYRTKIRRGEPIDGQYLRAQTYIQDYQRYVLSTLQNPDGSLSTDWFDRPANSPDLDRRLQTTGHMMEWLAFSLNDEQLPEPNVRKTIDYLAGILIDHPEKSWSIGPLGHALHALVIYDERVFQGKSLGGTLINGPAVSEAAALTAARTVRPAAPAPSHATDTTIFPWAKAVPEHAPLTLDLTVPGSWSNSRSESTLSGSSTSRPQAR